MQTRLPQPRRRSEVPHLRINMVHRHQLSTVESIESLCSRPSKEDLSPCDSTTLSGLEHRLYVKFQDSVRTERLRECNPLQTIEQQNQRLEELFKASQEELFESAENNPQFDHINSKLNALEKTCMSRKPPRQLIRQNRRVLGELQSTQSGPAEMSEEMRVALAALPCGKKVEQMIQCHNQLLRVADQISQANTQLMLRNNEQKHKLSQLETLNQEVSAENSKLVNQACHYDKQYAEFQANIAAMLEMERAKWELELQEEQRLLEKLNML